MRTEDMFHRHERAAMRESAGKLAIFVCGHSFAADQLARRALTDAIARALPSVWERRAEAYEWARPTDAELLAASPEVAEQLRLKHVELTRLAEVCRMHAEFLRSHPPKWLDELADSLPSDQGEGVLAA